MSGDGPQRGLRQRMGAWAIGVDFAWTVVGGVLLGLAIDWLLGTRPIFLLICMVGGLIGGFTVFIRAGLKASAGNGSGEAPDERSARRRV